MSDHDDPLERELAELRPAQPSAELAERIGAQLAVEATAMSSPTRKTDGTRSVPATYYWLATGGAIATAVLIAVAVWRGSERTKEAELPLELPQPTLATALDDSLPSVWTFRSAVNATASLDDLLDEHAAQPGSGPPEQTRGFVPVTMNMNSRLGEL